MRKALLSTFLGAALALAVASPANAERRPERLSAVSLAPAISQTTLAEVACSTEACPGAFVGMIELPVEGATVSGYVQIRGFALNGNAVSSLDVYLDGTDEVNRVTAPGGIKLAVPRPDVMQAFPGYVGTAGGKPGFEASFKASNYANGPHTIHIRVTDVTGCCYFLAPRTVTIDNARNQPPFGTLDYPLSFSGGSTNGVLAVVGWALDDSRVDHVDVYVDGRIERQAVTGVARPDVAQAYPDDTTAISSGFILNVDSTRLDNGVHEVAVKAVDDQGQQGLLGVRRVQVFNNAGSLPPFGDVEMPLKNSTWFGNCASVVGPPVGPSGGGGGPILDARYLMRVSGWALDASVAQERGGVSSVRVEIDGITVRDSRFDCRREPLLNWALVDCYGYYRPDIEMMYPGFPQAPNSGFQFFVDAGYLLTQGPLEEGAHLLTVKAGDVGGSTALLAEIPVVIECANSNTNPPPIGAVDDPTNYKFVSGVYTVLGWALDLDIVTKVRVRVDGVTQVDAVTGNGWAESGLASPDIAQLYPNYPQNSTARFRFYLDTSKLSNSEHDLSIEVEDGRGAKRSAATRRILVSNRTLVR
jgi:hypothetical protein